jgi:phage shock protein A
MIKQFVALVRGRAYDVAKTTLDGSAITILRQQIRDCVGAVSAARRAVAIAIAQNDQEIQQCKRLVARIEDLEERTLIALQQDKHELAREAAETVSLLESERDASLAAQASFAGEIERLKRTVRASETRLRELERGQRIASAVEKTQRLREAAPGSGLFALNDAEQTLERLRKRQQQLDVAAAAMSEMELSGNPETMSERLAEAGCGSPLKSHADDVLLRLTEKLNKAA